MPKKSIREMSRFQKLRNSLNFRMTVALVRMAVILGAAAVLYGYLLYDSAVRREYSNNANQLSQTAAVLIQRQMVVTYAKRVIEAYESMPEEERLDQYGETYRSAFDGIDDYGYTVIEQNLSLLQEHNGAQSIYFALIDEEHMRLIYIIDSDDTENHCPPGKWDEVDPEELQIYYGNVKANTIESFMGLEDSNAAYIYSYEDYGQLCTGASMITEIDGYRLGAFTDIDMRSASLASRTFLWQYALILLVLTVIITVLVSRHMKKTVVSPINRLAEAARSYVYDKRDNIEAGNHFADLNIRTGDEIENLSLIMGDMENDLNSYIGDLTEVTAEKERISTELDLACQIQDGMVPHTFPPFPDRKEFDIYAGMYTAREVGGDFYDFFLIDRDHLALVMADVSGKGIPAALFMMACKIMIGNITLIEKNSPAEILAYVNDQICANNSMEMFVTVWLGILEISTGTLKAASAGHEYPAIRKADGLYELYKDPHGLMIGGMPDMSYRDYEIVLDAGDCLFVYTDGVTEATDAAMQLYGTDRMLASLNRHSGAGTQTLIDSVKNDIDTFVGEAPQFDDITMMCLQYFGTEKE